MNEESEEIKKLNAKAMENGKYAARALLQANGENWVKVHGREKLLQSMEVLKGNLRSWNANIGTTTVLNIPTINAMMWALSSVTFVASDPKIQSTYNDFYMFVCAVRNELTRERDEFIAKSNPDLSTPP